MQRSSLPDPVLRPRAPRFAQVGRPPPIGRDAWSKPLMLLVAVGLFASFLSLVVGIQQRQHLVVVEVSFMEEEAEEAARALEAAAGEGPVEQELSSP